MQSAVIVLDKLYMESLAKVLSRTTQEASSDRRLAGVPAFKEWALVCDSIARGETSLLFRKGGIAEGRDGFEFKNQSFFLFPTYFHGQIQRTRLRLEGNVKSQQDPVTISVFVQVEFRTLIRDLALVPPLESLHVLQTSVLEERFHYDNREGLHVAFVRAYRISPVWEFPFHTSHGGCRSWVTLPQPPVDLRLESVLSDEEQSRRRSLLSRTFE
jgi:hypothetical protein